MAHFNRKKAKFLLLALAGSSTYSPAALSPISISGALMLQGGGFLLQQGGGFILLQRG
jgi:hypothetical protein